MDYPELALHIAGRWRTQTAGGQRAVVDPATETTLAQLPLASRDMVPLAHDTAQRLFAHLSADERRVLQSLVQKLFDSTTGFEPSGELE